MKIKVSVIIVTYNSKKTIKECLDSLKISKETEVIVIDNKSADKTLEIVKKFPFKIIENTNNLGFGKANNIGSKEALGETLFFLNPDCILGEEVTEKLHNYLHSNAEVAVVAPKLLNKQGGTRREMSPFPTFLSELLILLKLHRSPFLQSLVYPNYNFEKIQEVEHLMGAALMVRKDVFENVEGFDENFFLWFEETDLLKRIKNGGGKIVYFPQAEVVHIGSTSIKQFNPIKRQLIWNKSLLYYFKKHLGWFKLLLLLPFVALSFIPAAILSLKSSLTK